MRKKCVDNRESVHFLKKFHIKILYSHTKIHIIKRLSNIAMATQ